MAINIPGIISIIIFYILILILGLLAAYWFQRRHGHETTTETTIVANRNIGPIVGIFTMTATWVGGGYINGTAEAIYNPDSGFIWCQAPWAYAASLILGGLFYAKKMRDEGYVTMVDILQQRYGIYVGALLCFPAILGEIFWSAAVLGALGSTLEVIVELKSSIAIIVSALFAVAYTLVGGVISVAYTDVAQLICIFIGMWMTLPFAMTHEAAMPLSTNGTVTWMGNITNEDIAVYADSALMLILGGIPWQDYFQRVLSSNSGRTAQLVSYGGALCCLIIAIPSIFLGATAKTANWSLTSYNGTIPLDADNMKLTLPLVMQYMTPLAVSIVGMGAVSAAVMSSADAAILSVASLFARNIVQAVFCPTMKERHLLWIMQFSIIIVGALATVIAIFVKSTYALWFLCSDLVYCILFPQLTCALYLSWVNAYGSLMAFVVGFLLRLASGEPLLHLPALIKYPGYTFKDDTVNQHFPFRTFIMVVSLLCLLGISWLTEWLFISLKTKYAQYDVLAVFKPKKDDKNEYSHLNEKTKL